MAYSNPFELPGIETLGHVGAEGGVVNNHVLCTVHPTHATTCCPSMSCCFILAFADLTLAQDPVKGTLCCLGLWGAIVLLSCYLGCG